MKKLYILSLTLLFSWNLKSQEQLLDEIVAVVEEPAIPLSSNCSRLPQSEN